MQHDIAKEYISKLTDLYALSENVIAKMQQNADKITSAFKGYSWDHIEWAVDFYYVRKNDKTYPRMAQILAILNTNKEIKRVEDDPLEHKELVMPTTRIWDLQKVFAEVCRAAHRHGLAYFEYFDKVEKIKMGNKSYIKQINRPDGTTENVICFRNYDWDDAVNTARQAFPSEFNKYKFMSCWEKYAMAYKLGTLKI